LTFAEELLKNQFTDGICAAEKEKIKRKKQKGYAGRPQKEGHPARV
jgi:hypothetical protein